MVSKCEHPQECCHGGVFNCVGIAEVVYNVSYSTSSPEDVELSPLSGVVVFAAAQSQATITVGVVDDAEAELEELLVLSLVAVSGDAVLVSPDRATLVIEMSDSPNGVFSFVGDSQLVETDEGDATDLM